MAPDQPSHHQRFARSHRLTRGADLRVVGQEGKRIRTEHLELRVMASPLAHPRVGFIVPKHGHSSVERNRLKRRLREIIRRHVLSTLPQADVVVRARRDAYGVSFRMLEGELLNGAKQICERFGV